MTQTSICCRIISGINKGTAGRMEGEEEEKSISPSGVLHDGVLEAKLTKI